MNDQTVYILRFADATEVFRESETGVLDLVSREPPGSQVEPDGGVGAVIDEVVVEAEYYPPIIYQSSELIPTEFRYTCIRRDESVIRNSEIADFFIRYPVLRRVVKQGDYVAAARILRRSRKLRPFVHLVRYLFHENLFLVYTMEIFHRFYGGGDRQEDDITPLLAYCRNVVTTRDAEESGQESARAVQRYLRTHESGLVLPVVGTFARSTARDISDEISAHIRRARQDTLLQDDSRAGKRLDAYLQSILVEIRHEPQNPYDTNALAVWVKLPPILSGLDSSSFRHAGYLKREIAAVLAPLIPEDIRFSATLARITEGELDVRVVARENSM